MCAMKYLAAVVVGAIVLATAPRAAVAERLTQCTLLNFCYCVDTELDGVIEQRVAGIRNLLVTERDRGKLIGYISTPLSSLEGSYYGVNADVAADVKSRVEKRFGSEFIWMLNPGADYLLPPDRSLLPKEATGADYMWMWTRVLEGPDGLGRDFDLVYFVGPHDFRSTLKLTGINDLGAINSYYDNRASTDSSIKQIDRDKFRAYYGLRAAVTYSYGSHDEWNIARAINAKRLDADPKAGLAKQLAIYFDGKPISPPQFEASIGTGDAGVCRAK